MARCVSRARLGRGHMAGAHTHALVHAKCERAQLAPAGRIEAVKADARHGPCHRDRQLLPWPVRAMPRPQSACVVATSRNPRRGRASAGAPRPPPPPGAVRARISSAVHVQPTTAWWWSNTCAGRPPGAAPSRHTATRTAPTCTRKARSRARPRRDQPRPERCGEKGALFRSVANLPFFSQLSSAQLSHSTTQLSHSTTLAQHNSAHLSLSSPSHSSALAQHNSAHLSLFLLLLTAQLSSAQLSSAQLSLSLSLFSLLSLRAAVGALVPPKAPF